MNHNSHSVYVGIDIAKLHFDVNTQDGNQHQQFTYDEQEIKLFFNWIKKQNVKIICLEATGMYHEKLVSKLHDENFDIAVVNPRQIRDFAKSMGQLAKTDKIDAKVIAIFAERMNPRKTLKDSGNSIKLTALTSRRRQVPAEEDKSTA